MNALITSMGRAEEYKEHVISALDSYNVTVDKKAPIERLEKLLEQQRKKANG